MSGPEEGKGVEFIALSRREQQALSEILMSSKSFTGVTKQRVMRLLRVRQDGEFYFFIRKANQVLGHALKLVYDEPSDRCLAMTRANGQWVQEMLDERQLALLLFCFYVGMTSRTGKISFDELHSHFQRSSLYAERRLLAALDHLVKCGFLRLDNAENADDEESRRVYRLTAAGRNVFPPVYLARVLSESQGGEVSLEQVAAFFALDRQQERKREPVSETLQLF